VRVELVVAWTQDGVLGIQRRETEINVGGTPPPPDPTDDFKSRASNAVLNQADRLDIAAMASAFAEVLKKDGESSPPRIVDTADMGQAWSDLQKNYHGEAAHYGDRLPEFENVAADWLTFTLDLNGDALPLDEGNRRAKAVQFFLDLAGAMQ
jgi:hypothetical protein